MAFVGTWHRATVIRSGPGLRIDTSSGASLVISVDHPEFAVVAIDQFRGGRRPAGGGPGAAPPGVARRRHEEK
ncbi:MAG TPA: hypothetical protein VK659_04415 [Asanoa sp.]|nr:hypothetical protein [Asanoa sp.]